VHNTLPVVMLVEMMKVKKLAMSIKGGAFLR
jgi:hypothetical protein